MVFVCSICTNVLSFRPPDLPPHAEVELTSTRCGHLYHTLCLGNWFDRQDAPARHCPKCNALVSDADTTLVRPCGDGQNEADEDVLRREAHQRAEELRVLQTENEQMHLLLVETMDNLSTEATTNDMLSREVEKHETEIVKLKRENAEAKELIKVNKYSFETEEAKLKREKNDFQDNLGHVETALVRQRMDFEEQLQSRNLRIADLEANANELRKAIDYWRQQHNRLRRRDGHIDDDDIMTSKASQTENSELENLNDRLHMYKMCMEHMDSEYKLLGSMTLQAAAAAPCPVYFNNNPYQPMPQSTFAGFANRYGGVPPQCTSTMPKFGDGDATNGRNDTSSDGQDWSRIRAQLGREKFNSERQLQIQNTVLGPIKRQSVPIAGSGSEMQMPKPNTGRTSQYSQFEFRPDATVVTAPPRQADGVNTSSGGSTFPNGVDTEDELNNLDFLQPDLHDLKIK